MDKYIVPTRVKHTIRDLRVRAGLSQDQAACRMHISRKTLQIWENDPTKLSVDTINKISKLYEMHNFFEQVFRFWNQRRKAVDEERRVSALIANSNCIGTTSNLFCDKWSRASSENLRTTKKPDSNRA